jgi:hypothetical protein
MKIKISPSPFLIFFDLGNIYNKVLAELHQLRHSLNYFFAAFILFFPISESFPQNFFPLKVSNAYQIKNFWSWWGPGGGETGTNYYAITILADSVINGDIFFRFSNNIVLKNEYLFNYDSLNQKVFLKLPNDSTIRLGIDFNAPSDSNYTSYLRGSPQQFSSGGITNEVVLGDTHNIYSMQYAGSDNGIYKFADNIGISYFRNWGGIIQAGYESTQNVLSSIIDSLIYNPIVLGIDTLYPIQDRPIDTFPFLLTISYSASYSQLINSFYLEVEQVRADTLVLSTQYNISKSNPHITFNLPDLLVGDIIKLRATITDSSIFFNTAHYPDTGWVVITVLPPILNVEDSNTPLFYNISQNFPNPFNPITRIVYQIPEPAFVSIKIYDLLGNEIEILISEEKNAGSYNIGFDGSKLTSGIYYYRISAGEFSQTKKMILLK